MSVNNAVRNIVQALKTESVIIDKEIRLVGVTFEGRQDILDGIDSRTEVALYRERDNIYDSNAVSVVLKKTPDVKLGYISRKQNKGIASMLDKGETINVRVKRVISNSDKEDSHLGIVVVLEHLKKGELNAE